MLLLKMQSHANWRFNDGSLDLPRGKTKPQEGVAPEAPEAPVAAVERGSIGPAEQTFALAIWRGPYSPTIFSEGAESPPS